MYLDDRWLMEDPVVILGMQYIWYDIVIHMYMLYNHDLCGH